MEPEKIIELDVGGTIYTTTRDTLEKCDYFRRMLDGTMTEGLKHKGRIFIDRNGRYFKYVLEYLRSGDIPDRMDLSHATVRKVDLEFDFFGLSKINPQENIPDEDKPKYVFQKPFWYDFLLKKFRRDVICGDEKFEITFDATDPRQKRTIEDLETDEPSRVAVVDSIRRDLNRENDEVWSHMNDKVWLREQLGQITDSQLGKWETPQEELGRLRSLWQHRFNVESINDDYQAPDYRWTRNEKMPRIKHIIFSKVINKSLFQSIILYSVCLVDENF